MHTPPPLPTAEPLAAPTVFDPAALVKLGRIEVVAHRVVEGYMSGVHKSPYKGFSVEFAEHRQYYPGDEVRHIDWRAYGKTDHYYIKEYEEETNLRAYLVVDASGSMSYAGGSISKFQYVQYLAGALCLLLLRQRDAVGLVCFDTKVQAFVPPRSTPTHFLNVADALEKTLPGGETSTAEVLHHLAMRIKRRSMVVILSDCFDDTDKLAVALRHFRHHNHDVLLLHVVAPEEETFPFKHPTRFHSLERESHRLLVDPHRLRAHYLERFGAFLAELKEQAARCHVDYHKLATADPWDQVLGTLLRWRASRKAKRR